MAPRVLTALALALTVALSGCATRWVVDSQVRSFSELPAPQEKRRDRGLSPRARST